MTGDVASHYASFSNSVFDLLFGDTEVFSPITKLPSFMDIDALTIRRATFVEVV
jgi:hypothetical protein